MLNGCGLRNRLLPRVVLVLLVQPRLEQQAERHHAAGLAGEARRSSKRRVASEPEEGEGEAAGEYLNGRLTVDIWLNSIVPLLPRFPAGPR